MVCRPHIYSREGFQPTIKGSIVYRNVRAAPHNSSRSLRQDFCSNSKFRKWRNTVCISHFRNCGSGAKRRMRLADAIVRCCLRIKRYIAPSGTAGHLMQMPDYSIHLWMPASKIPLDSRPFPEFAVYLNFARQIWTFHEWTEFVSSATM